MHYYLEGSDGLVSNHGGDSRPVTAGTILSQMETPKHKAERFIHHLCKTQLLQQYPNNVTNLMNRQRSHSTLGTSQYSPGGPSAQVRGSLNYLIKKKEAARIDRENEKIMKSLLN